VNTSSTAESYNFVPSSISQKNYENKVEGEYIHISRPLEEQYVENDQQNREYEFNTVYQAPQVHFEDNLGNRFISLSTHYFSIHINIIINIY
jgi:hypothetical protein